MAGMESNSIFIVIIFIEKENALNYRQFFVEQCYENKRDWLLGEDKCWHATHFSVIKDSAMN